MKLTFNEVQTFVKDLERSIDFYQAILGLSLKEKGKDWAIFEISNIEFVILEGATPRANKREYGHLCETVLCLGSQNLEEDLNALVKEGVGLVKGVTEVAQGKFAVIQDPDENFIELIQN